MKIAVLDIGTNSIHVMVAEVHPNMTFEVLGREKDMTRLGDKTFSSGYLQPEVMDRGVATIKKFIHWARSKGAQKIIAVATSAVREAKNGGEFIQRISREAPLKVNVITGEEEGRLIYLGVKHSMDLKKGNALLVDIGGGSVEVTVGNAKKILFMKSLKIGVARLKDLFLKTEDEKGYARLEEHVREALKPVESKIRPLNVYQAIGTSRTFNNLAAMAFYAKQADQSLGRQPTLTAEDLKQLYRTLRAASPEERAKIKGIDPLRADLMPVGAALAYVLMRTLNVDKLTICDQALREGLFYDYIAKNRHKLKAEVVVPDLRRRNTLKLAEKCDYNRIHSEQVAKLALELFDQTKTLHRFGPAERELLEYAALLHDIGYHVSYEKHHLHAYYLIQNTLLNGFSDEEIDLLSHTVRYHRRSLPKKKHAEFNALTKEARSRVQWLAGILRVADALDRSHFSVISSLQAKAEKTRLLLVLKACNDSEYELWTAKKECELLEKAAGLPVAFEVTQAKKSKALRNKNTDSNRTNADETVRFKPVSLEEGRHVSGKASI